MDQTWKSVVEHLFKRRPASNPWCENSGEVSGRLHKENTYFWGTVWQQPQKTHMPLTTNNSNNESYETSNDRTYIDKPETRTNP